MADPTPIWLPVDPDTVAQDPDALEPAIDALISGQLVVYPTDTLYGLGADPRQPAAIERVFRAKGRPTALAVPLIAADVDQVGRLVGTLTPLGEELGGRFWPGPLTLVLDAHPTLDRRLLGGGETVAVRVPDHPIARALARELGGPITATSANRSGAGAADTAPDAVATLGPSSVSVVIDGGRTAGGEPSTIVDVRTMAPVLIRAGAIPWDRVVT